ncbi:MAG: hypothetical protein ACTSSA_12050 [Candidatus Freyarchaeota archaeon]
MNTGTNGAILGTLGALTDAGFTNKASAANGSVPITWGKAPKIVKTIHSQTYLNSGGDVSDIGIDLDDCEEWLMTLEVTGTTTTVDITVTIKAQFADAGTKFELGSVSLSSATNVILHKNNSTYSDITDLCTAPILRLYYDIDFGDTNTADLVVTVVKKLRGGADV